MFTTDLVPRSKYNFTVSMNHIDPAATGGLSTTVFERIQSVSMPGYSVKATTLNQYNKKKVVQSGIDYAPITMLAYDDRRGDFEGFLKEYSNYYYAGSMNYGTSFVQFNNAMAGTKLNDQKNFIKELTIKRINSITDTNVIRIYNPMITSIDADTLDYSESSLVQYRISFIYEGYDITTESYTPPSGYDEETAIQQALQQQMTTGSPTGTVTSPSEPQSEKENPPSNEDVKDTRFDEYIGMNRAEAKDLTPEERQAIKDSGQYEFVPNPPGPSTLQRRDDQPPKGEAVGVSAGDLREGNSNEIGVPVDNDTITSSKVIAENKDANGNVKSRVIEEKGVDADGFSYTETRREDVPPTEYRTYDTYVGQDVDTIPEHIANKAADSGAYYEDQNGKLRNYADDATHDEIMSTVVLPDEGFTDYDRRTNEHIGYNATLNEYSRFDNAQDAVDFAKYGDEKAARERLASDPSVYDNQYKKIQENVLMQKKSRSSK